MTTETIIGSYASLVPGAGRSLRDDVVPTLGDYVDDYDVDALVDAYQAAINEKLDEHGLQLVGGDQFVSTVPVPDGARELIKDAVDAASDELVTERFERNARLSVSMLITVNVSRRAWVDQFGTPDTSADGVAEDIHAYIVKALNSMDQTDDLRFTVEQTDNPTYPA